MKKKVLIVIVLAVIALIAKSIIPPEPEGVWAENKVSASFPDGVVNEPISEPTNQLVYIDVTGSMTPYYVKNKRTNVVNALSSVLTLIHRDSTHVRFLGGNEVHTGFGNDILQKAYDKEGIRDNKE
ncbi:MAG: hypothetical protein MJ236_05975, partial [Clostridia bacterium]|nr:hypothetical protein [Clostridia bacterium]